MISLGKLFYRKLILVSGAHLVRETERDTYNGLYVSLIVSLSEKIVMDTGITDVHE